MNEFEVRRDKTKSFKASSETIEKIDEIIKKSGKGPTEFFEDLVIELAITKIIDPDDETVSPDLRRNFESDVQKLKNATNSIVSIFISQMENVLVEKNQWQKMLDGKLHEKQEVIDKLTTDYTSLKQQFEENARSFTELSRVNDSTQKEVAVLSKRAEDQEQLIQDRTEKIADLQRRIIKLNENIVDKDERLKLIEPIKNELASAKQEIQSVQQEKQRLQERHTEEMQKQKENLLFASDKEKHALEMSLLNKFAQEKEEIRSEVRKETEQQVRDFYLHEMDRKEARFRASEVEYKQRIEQLEVQLNQALSAKAEEQ